MSLEPLSQDIVDACCAQINNLKTSINEVFIGQQEVIDQTITAFLAGGHVLLEGVPGLGKTLLIKALANSIELDYKRVQFTPDLMPGDVTGHAMFNMKEGEFSIRKGPAFTHLLLADEINRSPAKTQAALLEVMQELQITIDGNSLPLEAPFMVLATQNPIDNEGTYPLPEAELDRFMLKVLVEYPGLEEEIKLTQLNAQQDRIKTADALPQVLNKEEVLALREHVKQVLVDEKLIEYAVAIVRATREWQGVLHGAGTRAGIALIQVAKVVALSEGLGFVTPDHVKRMVLPVLRHRIILSADREIAGATKESVLLEIIDQVPAPRQ